MLQAWQDVFPPVRNYRPSSPKSDDTNTESIFIKKQKLNHHGIPTVVKKREVYQSEIPSVSFGQLLSSTSLESSPSSSSLSPTGSDYPSRYAIEMQGDNEWNADMEEFNTTMGGTDGSEDSEIPRLADQISDNGSDIPDVIDAAYNIAEILAGRDTLSNELPHLIRIGALSSE